VRWTAKQHHYIETIHVSFDTSIRGNPKMEFTLLEIPINFSVLQSQNGYVIHSQLKGSVSFYSAR